MIHQEFYQEGSNKIKKKKHISTICTEEQLQAFLCHRLTDWQKSVWFWDLRIWIHETWQNETIKTAAALTVDAVFCNMSNLPHGGRNSSTSCWTHNNPPPTRIFQENHLLETSHSLMEDFIQTLRAWWWPSKYMGHARIQNPHYNFYELF